jgi:hypothetical protein
MMSRPSGVNTTPVPERTINGSLSLLISIQAWKGQFQLVSILLNLSRRFQLSVASHFQVLK